jgi:membrane associated rhomboid family serine protease
VTSADDAWVEILRGRRRLVFESALVLAAKDVDYEVFERPGIWLLHVPAVDAQRALAELEAYAAERRLKRARRLAVPFGGAGGGAVVYGAILLAVAYCNGASWGGVDWLAAGALESGAEARGQWWRTVTALCLHLDPVHLAGNLLFGSVAGTLCGRLWGPGVAWLSILTAAVLANAVEMAVAPAGERSVGASTAVFAALGLLAGYAWRRQLPLAERWLYRVSPLIAGASLLALLGAGSEHVDVLGHALGFVAGLGGGCGFAWAGVPRSRASRVQVASGTLAVVLVTGAWVLALRHA